jgi:hypothetical protein
MPSTQLSRAVYAGLNAWLIFHMIEDERNKILAGLIPPTTYKIMSKIMTGPPVPIQTMSVCKTLDESKATLTALAAGARKRPQNHPDVQLKRDGCMFEFLYGGGTEVGMRFWVKGHVDGDEEDE